MKKTCVTFLAEHGLTLLTGTLLGATLTAGMAYESSTDFWQTIDSLSAGFGTIGLLLFGFKTANGWKEQTKENNRIQFYVELSKTIYPSVDEICKYLRESPTAEIIYNPDTNLDERKDINKIYDLFNSIGSNFHLLEDHYQNEPELTDCFRHFANDYYTVRRKLSYPPFMVEDYFELACFALNAQKLTKKIMNLELLN